MEEKTREKSKKEFIETIKKIKKKEHKMKKIKQEILKSQQESIEDAD